MWHVNGHKGSMWNVPKQQRISLKEGRGIGLVVSTIALFFHDPSLNPNEVFWAINPDLSYNKFDFSWRPNEENFSSKLIDS